MKRLAFLVLFLAATSGVALAQWAAVLAGSRASAAPSPPSTNLVEQLDANTLSGSDGSTISLLTATVGTNATSPSGKEPLLYNAVKNGKNIARFDGTDDYLTTVNFGSAVTQGYVIFIVFKLNSSSGAQWIFDGNNDTHRGVMGINTNFRYYAGGSDWTGPSTPKAADTNWHITSIEFNGASSKVRFDGGSEDTMAASPGASQLDGISIGINSTKDGGWASMDVGEVLIYTGTMADKSAVFSYLNTKWAVY